MTYKTYKNHDKTIGQQTLDISRSRLLQTSAIENELFQSNKPKNFDEQLEKISENNIGERNKTIVFSDETPMVFREIGLNNLSVEIFTNKIARALYLDSTAQHGHRKSIDKAIVKKVARKLADPIAIFKSATVPNSLVALYDIEDLQKHWVMISIVSSKRLKYHEVNLISSIYSKSYSTYKNWIGDGLLLYYDDKKDRELTVRLQLPSVVSLSKNSVLSKSELVNIMSSQCFLTF